MAASFVEGNLPLRLRGAFDILHPFSPRKRGRVAQLVRALPSHGRGHWSESSRAHHSKYIRKSASLADFSLFCEHSASSRLKPEALARSSCPFVQGGVPWRRYVQKYEQSSALLDRRTFRHLVFQVANSIARSSVRANGKNNARACTCARAMRLCCFVKPPQSYTRRHHCTR